VTAEPPFVLAWEDRPAYWAGATRRLLRGAALRLGAGLALCALVPAAAGLLFEGAPIGPITGVALLLAAPFAALGAREYVILRSRLRWWRHPEQYGIGPTTLHVDAEGLRLTSSTSAVASRWEAVQGVLRTRRLVILRLGRSLGVAVPRSAFADADAERRFVAQVRAWCATRSVQDGPAPILEVPEGAAPRNDPEAIHVTWDHGVDDSVAFIRWARWDRRRPGGLVTIGGGLLVLTSLLGTALLAAFGGNRPVELLPFLGLGLLAIVYGTAPRWARPFFDWRTRRRLAADPHGQSLGRHTLHAGPTGLYNEMPGGSASLAWSQVTAVVGHGEHTFLMLGPWHAWVVPDRAFGGAEAAERFRDRAGAWRARPTSTPAPVRRRPLGDNPFEAPDDGR